MEWVEFMKNYDWMIRSTFIAHEMVARKVIERVNGFEKRC